MHRVLQRGGKETRGTGSGNNDENAHTCFADVSADGSTVPV